MLLAACLSTGAGAAPPAQAASGAAAVELLAHRAEYRMERQPGREDSPFTTVRGRMEIHVERSCDGFGVRQYMGFHLYDTEGQRLEHLAWLSGFESADGSDFWFNARSWENRELADLLAGEARSAGTEHWVRYSAPEARRTPLPAGTLFPNAHIRELIAAARAGQRHLTRIVFDGTSAESPFEISAFIGRRRAPAEDAPAPLRGQAAWPLRLAYYPVGSQGPEPDFEMSALLYENGIAGDMVYDYADFAVAVTLERLTALAHPECP